MDSELIRISVGAFSAAPQSASKSSILQVCREGGGQALAVERGRFVRLLKIVGELGVGHAGLTIGRRTRSSRSMRKRHTPVSIMR